MPKRQEVMTVEELIDALRGYDPDTEVYMVERMGPTNALRPISDLTPQRAVYSDQRDMMVVTEHSQPYHFDVIALESNE